jgi:hypothetical protein
MAPKNARGGKSTSSPKKNRGSNGKYRGFTFRADDVINKMKKLRQKYKVEKDRSSKSGRGRRKPWKIFSIFFIDSSVGLDSIFDDDEPRGCRRAASVKSFWLSI